MLKVRTVALMELTRVTVFLMMERTRELTEDYQNQFLIMFGERVEVLVVPKIH